MKRQSKIKVVVILASFLFCLFGCKQGEITHQRSNFIYQDKTYSSLSKHVFSSFNELGFENNEHDLTFSNCKLEYIGLGNIKFIERSGEVNYYDLDDKFVISYDNSDHYFFSKIWLYTDNSLTLPDFTTENISEIQECIGVPRFAGYDEFFEWNHQAMDYTMKDVYTEFLYTNDRINDPTFIKRFVDEVIESGSVKSMADEVMTSNEDKVKKAQEEYSSRYTDNEKISVYYKVCFKNEDFPFRLIFTF